ncbi:MAG: hypothetical protein D6729_15685 [Deltaproteobacteria bacterium]|nr:MAG: hypothetical protein D6729_15685 [Deltaproteobacteria bacterium]
MSMENDIQERKAFTEAVKAHLDELIASARHHIAYHEAREELPKDSISPEELVGETLIRACAGRERQPADLRRWLLTLEMRTLDEIIAKNLWEQDLWAVHTEDVIPPLDPLELDDTFWDWYQPDEIPPRVEDVIPAGGLVDEISHEAASALPVEQWRAWLLSEVHGFTPEQIGAALRIPTERAEELIRAAKAALPPPPPNDE